MEFNVGDLLVVTESLSEGPSLKVDTEHLIFNKNIHCGELLFSVGEYKWNGTLSEDGKSIEINGVERTIARLIKKVLPDT